MIHYSEDSDYGQDVLQIMGEVAELMDPEKAYTKKEITDRLNRIKNWAYNLKMNVIRTPADSQFWEASE